MGVVHGFHQLPGAGSRQFDPGAVELFLRAQSAWLGQGLARALDPVAVRIVLAAHDASHPSWLGVIAATQQALGAAPGQALAGLYAFHGRVAGCLERGPDPLLDALVAEGVRRLLSVRLAALTEAAVAASVAPGAVVGATPAEARPAG
ncbi:MAG TPA: hypothetical protein VM324_06360 [Egibacteraceae bacterium]|nr:hypothetical protein [Egibacteraceae bacterium]